VYNTLTLSSVEAYNIKEYELRPSYVRDIAFVWNAVNQSKPFPCAPDNTITVGLALNVPLLGTCKNAHTVANVYNYTPSVTVKGLVGSESRTRFLPVTMSGGPGPFEYPFASWDRGTGELRLTPTAPINVKTVAGMSYFFMFNLRNPTAPSANPPSVSISVDTVLQTNGALLNGASSVDKSGTGSNFKSNAEVHPLFIRTPVIAAKFAQGSWFPCDSNTIAVTMISNVPLYANCTPTFTISGLTNTITGSPNHMTFMPLDQVAPSSLEINGTAVAGTQAAQWQQSSGRLHWSVTNDLVVDPAFVQADGDTSFQFNFTVMNWHKGRPGSLLAVDASFVDPWSQVVTAFKAPDAAPALPENSHLLQLQQPNDWLHPLHLQTPAITKIWMTQTSPYPCDTNVIRVDIMTNTKIFEACKPSFTISGLEGHETNTSLLGVSYPTGYSGIAANGTFSSGAEQDAVYWNAGPKFSSGPTMLSFGVTTDIPLKYNGGLAVAPPTDAASSTLSFTFEITNQAQFRDAPALVATAQYATSVFHMHGSAWPLEYSTPVSWDTSNTWAVNELHDWKTQHARAIYNGNAFVASTEKRPLHIRKAEFITKGIGQTYPWPAARNTIKVTLSLNMDLLVVCKPIIKISKLEGACIDRTHHVLAGTNANKFSSDNSTAGFATWSARDETLTMRGQAAVGFDRATAPDVESNTNYQFEFDISNPVYGQEGPDIQIGVWFDQTPGQMNTYSMIPDTVTNPGGANHIYFKAGDAKALDIYPAEFIVKKVRQSNPFPGMLNKITISLAANVDLVSPAAVTVSGFHINEAIRNLPELQGQILAPLGPLALTDAPSPTAGCMITSGSNGYTCSHGKGNFKATSSAADVAFGMFDDEYGRLVLNLGADLLAGNHIVFQFTVRNPYCGQPAVTPCVRANRILTNKCEPASIPRAMMAVEEISTADMNLPVISTDRTLRDDKSVMVAVPGALPGEALPLFTRSPQILLAAIGQSSVYPCATNQITVTVATNVPLVAAVNITVTISGLKGRRQNQDGTFTPVSMAGPSSGSLAITDPTNVFASTGAWNLESGELVLRVVADSMAGKRYVLSFNLQNPSKEQEHAIVYLKISTFCFGDKIQMTTNSSTASTAQGNCGSFSTTNLEPGIPPRFGGTPQNLASGALPLKVVRAELHTHFVNQSSQYPCTDNVIQVILASNVPLSHCAAKLTIRGLDNTLTNSTETLSVSVTHPSASTTAANWSQTGILRLDSSSTVPTSACQIYAFTFTLKNQMTPRSKASVFVEMSGNLNFHIPSKELTVPSTLNTWYVGLPGISNPSLRTVASWRDPLVVLQPAFTTRKMSQSSPWPGAANTLSVTFAANTPFTTLCSTLKIIKLEGACSSSGRKAFLSTDRDIEVGSLTFKPVADTVADRAYSFTFSVTNPVIAQNSPGIQIVALGIPIQPTLFQKEMENTLTAPCDAVSLACKWVAGDAAPLKVYAPMFLQKDISQNNPYPLKPNTISVTLMTNIPLSVGSLITLSNLGGASTETGVLTLSGSDSSKFQAGSGSGTQKAHWDSEYKKLTLRVSTQVPAGQLTKFSFVLQNPNCSQPSQAVCVRASRISTSCLDCSLGQCVTLTRQSMDRDFVTILGYGALGNRNHGSSAYYSSSAVVTYAEQPPQAGDAAPLLVYAPKFVVSNITQDNPYPGGQNVITATISTSVPLVVDSIITISGLAGSVTNTDPKFNLTSHSSVFASMAPWTNSGTLRIKVTSDTIAGEIYSVSFTVKNPDCAQSAPPVHIEASPICFPKTQMTSYVANMATPSHLSGIWSVTAMESSPLFVRGPSFLVKEVWQTKPFGNALNTIYVKFASNVDIIAGTKLTISGLVGAVDYGSDLTVSETGSSVLSSSGTWNNATGTLDVAFSAKSVAGTNYTISFVVKNPSCCNVQQPNIKIDCSVQCWVPVDAHVVTKKGLLSSVPEGQDLESAPLKLRCPIWRQGSISQATDFPCQDNQLSAKLAINVPIPAGAMLTITGLTDTGTKDGKISITSNPAAAMSYGNFSQADGVLLIPILQEVAALTNISFSFTIINPPKPVSSKVGQVKMNLDKICLLSPDYVLEQTNGGVIRVQPATFNVKKIGQKTFWPGAANVITVTVDSAVPLFGSTVRCDTNITIKGLNGACITGDSILVNGVNMKILPLSGQNASLFKNVTWDPNRDAVSMRIAGPLGVEGYMPAIFSFALVNPVASQPSPKIEINAQGIPIEFADMVKDNSKLPDSTYDHGAGGNWDDSTVQHVGSPNGAVFNSTARAAEPLRIISPAFMVRKIGQSSPYPGDNNTLSVTIQPNVDISVGAVIVISSLMAADGTEGAKTGALKLSDGSTDPGGKTTSDDTRYFASYTGGTSGSGQWDDSSRSLTLFVVSKLTAGSFYSFSFALKNPLCGQSGQPVCIRARNINVGCANGVAIPRRLMDHDLITVPSALNAVAGHAAPLMIYKPTITLSELKHSSPWPSANNTLTITFKTNVPLLVKEFAPKVTITNLVGSVTHEASRPVTWTKVGGSSSTLSGSWDRGRGELIFSVPSDTIAGDSYAVSFELKNKNCQQAAPDAVIDIDGACFAPRNLTKSTSTHCNLPTKPMQILGGPCSGGGETSALFTLKNISQSTPYPGCSNTITVEITANIPLRYQDKAAIEIFFSNDLAVGLLPGDVVLGGANSDRFFGTRERSNETARGRWAPEMNPPRMILNVRNGKDLEACTKYTVTFTVVNPMTDNVKASQPSTASLLQEAKQVRISAKGADGPLIYRADMVVDLGATMSLPGTSNEDLAPLQVHRPYFMMKTMAQSKPYPGAKNTLTVTLSSNTNIHTGSIIAIHQITGAIAADGNIRLNGTDSARFKSLTGAVGFGTWNDCEKALLLTPVSGLACTGQNLTFTFEVWNPVEPQLSAEVLINVTKLKNGDPFKAVAGQPATVDMTKTPPPDKFGSVYGGYDMLRDTWSTPPGIYGAMAGDASPMTVWPAAFLIKNIGQSNQYPGGLNTLTVTLATNVPMYPKINYPGRTAIQTKIILKRLTGAVQDNLDSSGSKSITLASSEGSTIIHSKRYYNNTAYFTDASGTANKGVWNRGPPEARNEPSLTLYRNPSVETCCIPEAESFFVKFSFTVYNPCSPQSPNHAVSIMAEGIPIIQSAMREDLVPKKPMHILSPEFTTKSIAQSDASPCTLNYITVSLKLNVDLYARCKPVIVLSDLYGLKESMFTNLTTKYWTWVKNSSISNATVSAFHRHEVGLSAVGANNMGDAPANLNSAAEWSNETEDSSKMIVNISSATVTTTTTLSFQFLVRNGAYKYVSSKAPLVSIEGIGMQNTTMSLPLEQKQRPITTSAINFVEASMVQSTPFPAALNTLTVTLKLDEDLSSEPSCGVKIVISGLEGACISDTNNIITLNGAARMRFAAEPTSNDHSKAKWDPNVNSMTMYLSKSGGGLEAEQNYVLTFDVRNPNAGQQSPAINIEVFGISIAKQAMAKNPNNLPPPGVFGGTAVEGQPLYVRGLEAASGFLTKKIGQSSADPGASNVITMTLKVNVPLTASSPVSAITVSGLRGASATHGTMALTVVKTASSGDFSGKWDDTDKALILDVTQDTKPGEDYKISFTVTNDKKAQTSPALMIETSGIVIQATEMVSETGKLSTKDDDGANVDTPEGAKAPLYVLAPKLIKRYAHQSGGSAWPAQQNTLTLSFTPTVDIVPIDGATVSVMVTGLKGIDKSSGIVTLGGSHASSFTDCRKLNTASCTQSRATWDSSSRKLTMNVFSKIAAFTDVTVTFTFQNSKKGQDSPKIGIELVTEIDSQAMKGLYLTLYDRKPVESQALASTIAQADSRFQQFTKNVTKKVDGLFSKATIKDYFTSSSLSRTTQAGAVYEGNLIITEAGDYLFGNTGDDYVDISVDGKVVSWRNSWGNDIKIMNAIEPGDRSLEAKPKPVFLTKGKHTFRARMIQTTGNMFLDAWWKTPSSPNTFQRIPNTAFEIKVEPLQLSPQDFGVEASKKYTDNVPLLIYRSASFTTKKIGQSSSTGTTPGATNTITVTIRPQFALTGAKKAKITITGLVGSLTPDSTLPLLDANALFNSTALWSAQKGSLILSVAPGQTVPSNADTEIKFDLSNPTIPQAGVSMVQISADGDVPISASAMDLPTGNAVPLKVLAATFTKAEIGQSSSAPLADNTITVTIQPSVILNKGRRSTLTLHGLSGSDTKSTRALPLAISGGSVPTFTSPFADLRLTFGPGCELANNRVLILDSSGTNYTGSELYATEGTCKGNKTLITSYNVSTGCATLENNLCSGMGAVKSVKVLDGGEGGYMAGPLFTAPGTAGSGLDGNCTVDDLGRITGVTLFDGGSGYADGTQIFCPSACDSTTCGKKSKSGVGAMTLASVTPDLAALASAAWDQVNGKLEMRVRGELNATDPLVMSFKLKNGKTPQAGRDVYVMAGGASPVGTTKMTGNTTLSISGLQTTVTGLCKCAPTGGSSACTCSTTMSNIPTGRDVYALKAEYQCNGGASLVLKVDSVATAVEQPPTSCKDSCQTYHTLLSWYNVAGKVKANGELPLSVEASGVSSDYCGAGDNLKVVFTLIY